jgi:predicted ATP-dependent Lon-type protease
VNIPENIVNQYPMLLAGGMWGTIDLTYDETEVHNKKIRPFKPRSYPVVGRARWNLAGSLCMQISFFESEA